MGSLAIPGSILNIHVVDNTLVILWINIQKFDNHDQCVFNAEGRCPLTTKNENDTVEQPTKLWLTKMTYNSVENEWTIVNVRKKGMECNVR